MSDTSEPFPLDAFFIPEHASSLPAGMTADSTIVAARVADRLEDLSRRVRVGGVAALGAAPDVDELARLIRAAVASYLTRRG